MDTNTLAERWKDSLTGRDAQREDPAVARLLHALDQETVGWMDGLIRDAGRSSLWLDLCDPGNLYRRDQTCFDCFVRLERMALCYAAPGCRLSGDAGLRSCILDSLRFLLDGWYNETTRQGGEWWYKEIGIPLRLNRILCLMGADMEEALAGRCIRAMLRYTRDPSRMCLDGSNERSTGANRAWKCLALAGVGAVSGETDLLESARDCLREVFSYTEAGDGFYRDGSFVQHRKFPYNGGYGLANAGGIHGAAPRHALESGRAGEGSAHGLGGMCVHALFVAGCLHGYGEGPGDGAPLQRGACIRPCGAGMSAAAGCEPAAEGERDDLELCERADPVRHVLRFLPARLPARGGPGACPDGRRKHIGGGGGAFLLRGIRRHGPGACPAERLCCGHQHVFPPDRTV